MNLPKSLSLTSWITPRPNCAGLPVMARSVLTSTAVPSPSGVSCARTVAAAVPLPRLSLPLASKRAVWLASSRSRKVPVPEYCIEIGPSLTLTLPVN